MTRRGRMLACQVLVLAATVSGCGGSQPTITQTTTAPTAAAAAVPLHWQGNGTRNLGTVTVAHDATMRFNVSPGASLLIGADLDPGGPTLNVESQSSGQSFVQAGTYTNVQVISTGDWSITIG